MDFPDAKPAVFVLIVNEEKQILLGRRKVGPQEGTLSPPLGPFAPTELRVSNIKSVVSKETGLGFNYTSFVLVVHLSSELPQSKDYFPTWVGVKLHHAIGQKEPMTPESSAYESWKWVSKDELERLYEEYKAAEEDGKIDDFKGEILCLTLRVLLKNQGRGTHSINHLFDIPSAYPSLDSSGLY
ncbi:hypothetical protein BDV32DRAFT_144875 [Aspergillus pseudonomiae]|uniref:Uncharacterized protein n=1 Tax=Aspergillus pseudonomiae TaxID=1506151 RepID=A0A5N7DM89_9EURO|nr:uncharacterized protein BDV37DRAFT_280037 [Aspergillus pseudonomiae]KAB8264840.1 hypothetical protein BDV32DRAFT_144875 [Aspergillus pseudonomiae]KAE8407504.1 hypothetical protein BDV37DRAFT_280037 [Aspergillus pseudonomiae]